MKLSIKLGLFAVALATLGSTAIEAKAIREGKIVKISIGMDQEEVTKILGKPSRTLQNENVLEYRFKQHRPVKRFVIPFVFVNIFAPIFTYHTKYQYWVHFQGNKVIKHGRPGHV